MKKQTFKQKCQHCSYTWESRKPSPKACPRCKNRLDLAYSQNEKAYLNDIARDNN